MWPEYKIDFEGTMIIPLCPIISADVSLNNYWWLLGAISDFQCEASICIMQEKNHIAYVPAVYNYIFSFLYSRGIAYIAYYIFEGVNCPQNKQLDEEAFLCAILSNPSCKSVVYLHMYQVLIPSPFST